MDAEALAHQVTQLLVPLIVPAVAYLLAMLRRWRINDVVLRAIVRGAGAAYLEMVRSRPAAGHSSIESAVEIGAAYVESRVGATLPKAGFTDPAAVRDAVRAQLGTLLAADPTVGVKAGV